jgi:hypothetical protein
MLKAIECSHGVEHINPTHIVSAREESRTVRIKKKPEETTEEREARKNGRKQPAVAFVTSNAQRFVFKGTMEEFHKAIS